MTGGESGLVTAERELGEDELDALRRAAYRVGRVIEHDGLGLFCVGEAADLALPGGLADPAGRAAAAAALEAITPVAGARGALCVAALPFARRAPGCLVVPEVTAVVSPGGPAVLKVVAVAARIDALLARPLAPDEEDDEPPPDAFTLGSALPHADYLARVEAALVAIDAGHLEKVVLARAVDLSANRPLRTADLLTRLRALHPSCATFSLDGFVGATPELLLRRSARHVESHPLAGTVARSGDPATDERLAAGLIGSAKDRAEHDSVVRTIVEGLTAFCATLAVPDAPEIVELRNVAHLGTALAGELADGGGGPATTLEILAALHPTPAVAGTPRDAALSYLAAHEALERDRYAGPLGWIDASGDGEWWIGIRSAQVAGRTARLFAGAGIVAGSDPDAELAETQLKLQAMLAAAVRP